MSFRFMTLARWQRLTSSGIALLGLPFRRLAGWLRRHPGVGDWFLADARSPEERYRRFNEWCFARFDEQERMLADRVRMDFYQAAIARRVQPGDRVIDLGTGTGILAAMAARRGAARVYAIDHSDILRHARSLATANEVRQVEFIATHSREFHLEERVDVIVQEQMGDFLFDESMIANVTDLRDRLLKPGGAIVPGCFDFFCEPVTISDERRVPFIWELDVKGYSYAVLAGSRPLDPSYYRQSFSGGDAIAHFLGEPEPLCTFDLHTVSADDIPCDLTSTRVVHEGGRLDGFVVYFRARVDDDLVLTTDPKAPNRATHWGLRVLRVEQGEARTGATIHFNLRVGDWSDPDTWRWEHRVAPAAVEAIDAPSGGQKG
ncbi:MAG TPA: 50S ribosomal protein L11 methyltransferase [Candidatus Didemnitutus sp.]|jgi:protein arginine N-methyltransferase 1